MSEEKKLLAMLQLVVPSDTPVTTTAIIRTLEILGIVNSPEIINSLQLTTAIIPPNTPGSLHVLIVILGNIIKHHPKATKAHHEALAKTLKDISALPDAPLTFSTFLPICEGLMAAASRPRQAKA